MSPFISAVLLLQAFFLAPFECFDNLYRDEQEKKQDRCKGEDMGRDYSFEPARAVIEDGTDPPLLYASMDLGLINSVTETEIEFL